MKLEGYGVLQIEPTDNCNLNCKMCKPHAEGWAMIHSVSKGFLDVDVWRKIVSDFKRERIVWDHIIFQWLGDPLIHPEIDQLIAIAAKELSGSVGYLRLDSNMIALDQRRMLRLLNVAAQTKTPMLLVASIDAASPEVYSQVKGKDRLKLVHENLRRFLRFRRKLQSPVNLQVQFVVQEENGKEVLDFLTYWSDLFACQGGEFWHDEILFKRLSVDGGGEGQAAADLLYQKFVLDQGIRQEMKGHVQIQVWTKRPWQEDDAHIGTRTACPGLWMTPVIRHDGQLMMCCADLQGELNLGSLKAHHFLELWNGVKAQAERRRHLSGEFRGVCQGCGGINWYDLPEDAQELVQIRN